jgi:uncharacterized protein
MRARIALLVRQHPVFVCFLLAFAISWAGVLWAVASTGIPGTGSDYAERGPLVFLAMLVGPSVAGLGLLATPDKGMVIGFALAVGLGAGYLEDLGWTGFALPRLLHRSGWLTAGLLLGSVWGLWHLLADYWGNADTWGPLYAPRFLLWCGASFTAYRILIAWAYSHTNSLLLAQLMHAGFTGGQVLLAPVLAPSARGLVWYAAFAGALWLIVGVVAAVERAGRPARSASPAYAPG